MLKIEISAAIDAVHRARDDLYVALMLRLGFVIGCLLLTFAGFLISSVLLALLLGQILGRCSAGKGDRLSIWRPYRRAHASGQVGHLPGFASSCRKHVKLWPGRPARSSGAGSRGV